MELNKEVLLQKKQELSAQLDQLKANANATIGGLQLIEMLLAHLEVKVEPLVEKAKEEIAKVEAKL